MKEIFPFKDLINILAFEDVQEAHNYCAFYSLPVSENGVQFKTVSVVIPEQKFPLRRADTIIESKVSGVSMR